MSISYPLSLPATPAPARVRWGGESMVALSSSPFTREQQAQVHQGMMWRAGVTLPPMARADAEAWVAILLALNGRQGTFLMGDPAGATPRGTALGTPLVNGAGQTGQALATDGWTADQNGILLPGDYIQLGTGVTTRLYRVLTSTSSNGSGQATIDIWPRLRESPGNNDPLTVTSCKGTFRLASNAADWEISAAIHYGIGFEAMEAI